jgi:hypothetical protein
MGAMLVPVALRVGAAVPPIVVECHSEDDDYWKLVILNGILKEVEGSVVYPEIDIGQLYEQAGQNAD